jgi:hypothetical protein
MYNNTGDFGLSFTTATEHWHVGTVDMATEGKIEIFNSTLQNKLMGFRTTPTATNNTV